MRYFSGKAFPQKEMIPDRNLNLHAGMPTRKSNYVGKYKDFYFLLLGSIIVCMCHLNKKKLQCNVGFIIHAEEKYTKTVAQEPGEEKWKCAAVIPHTVSELVKYRPKADS